MLPLFLSACGASLSAALVVLFAASTWLLGVLFYPASKRGIESAGERERALQMCTHNPQGVARTSFGSKIGVKDHAGKRQLGQSRVYFCDHPAEARWQSAPYFNTLAKLTPSCQIGVRKNILHHPSPTAPPNQKC